MKWTGFSKASKIYNHIQYFLTPLSNTHPAHEISTLALPHAPISAFVISGQFHPIFHFTILVYFPLFPAALHPLANHVDFSFKNMLRTHYLSSLMPS